MLDIDDKYPQHPKLLALGNWAEVAGWLNLAAIAYSARYLTDGRIPRGILWHLSGFRGLAIDGEPVTPDAVATRLVNVGLWADLGVDGYEIHDFLEYQESRAHALARRDADRARKRGGGSNGGAPPPGFPPESGRNPHGFRSLPSPLSPPLKEEKKGRQHDGGTERDGPLPGTFELDAAMADQARRSGCQNPSHAFAKFRAHALEHDRRAVDWRAAWAGWCLGHDPTRCCVRRAPPRSAPRDVDRPPSEPVALGAILQAAMKTRGTS